MSNKQIPLQHSTIASQNWQIFIGQNVVKFLSCVRYTSGPWRNYHVYIGPK